MYNKEKENYRKGKVVIPEKDEKIKKKREKGKSDGKIMGKIGNENCNKSEKRKRRKEEKRKEEDGWKVVKGISVKKNKRMK